MSKLENILGLRQFTGWHMLGVLFLFFGTIISVNLTLAYYANSSWTGLVVKNSYVESQRFNDVTAEKRRQAELGWVAVVAYDADAFSIDLSDKNGNMIRDAIVTAKIGHPANERADRTVTLNAADAGRYVAPVALDPGYWSAYVTVTGPKGEVWTREIRFTVKG
jgi:nitrogen fixation protein FixH